MREYCSYYKETDKQKMNNIKDRIETNNKDYQLWMNKMALYFSVIYRIFPSKDTWEFFGCLIFKGIIKNAPLDH